MKNLTNYIQEKLIISKDYTYQYAHKYHPKSWDELRKIIEQRYKKQGPGTEQDPIDFNDINISGMTTFYDESNGSNKNGIFEEIRFKYIDISNWDVSNVKDMSFMFDHCTNLKSVGDLSNWDVSNVEDMRLMFSYCKKLESVGDLSKWKVSNVKDMQDMFAGCEKLESIGDLSKWNVSNVEDLSGIFYCCKNLKSVGDLSNWDVSNAKNIGYMFTDSAITNIPDWH